MYIISKTVRIQSQVTLTIIPPKAARTNRSNGKTAICGFELCHGKNDILYLSCPRGSA